MEYIPPSNFLLNVLDAPPMSPTKISRTMATAIKDEEFLQVSLVKDEILYISYKIHSSEILLFIKTKVNITQAYVTLSCLGPLIYLS